MARPTVLHEGFLIPNAGDVSNPRMAEPDRIDFSTLAQSLWGVIEGCTVTVSGMTATIQAGSVLVNGVVVTLATGTVNLTSGLNDRFDLIVVMDGVFDVIKGTPGVDPVFPNPPINATMLAAVFCPVGVGVLDSNVIDKRKFVPKALLTKIETTAPLIQNLNGTGNHFLMTGDGKAVWEGDTALYRSAVGTVRIENNLSVLGGVSSGFIGTGVMAATGTLTGSNLIYGATLPGSAPVGALFQNSVSGKVFLRKAAGTTSTWEEMATVNGTVPVGAILQSLEVPAIMRPRGWVQLDGSTVQESEFPNLFQLSALTSVHSPTGLSPNRTMVLPNASGKMLLSTNQNAGTTGGPANNEISLAPSQLPAHKHGVSTAIGGGATPVATMSIAGIHRHTTDVGGYHTHTVAEAPHQHQGMSGVNGVATEVIAVVWGGGSKLDGPFNDSTHTYSVEKLEWSAPAVTSLTVQASADSAHGHSVLTSGEHIHPVSVSPILPHSHEISEALVGSGASINITPSYLTVFTYIRS